MSELLPVPVAMLFQPYDQVSDEMREYIARSKAVATLTAYQADLATYLAWCDRQAPPGLAFPATPAQVADYIVHLARRGRRDGQGGLKASSIRRAISAIARANAILGGPLLSTRQEPLHSVWQGVLRTHGAAPAGRAALRTADLRDLIAATPDRLLGIRDRAILLLGYAGAFRRSELAALVLSDLAWCRDGITVTLRRSKTDQTAAGREVGIPYGSRPETCPVRAVQDWVAALATLGMTEGRLFRGVDRHGQIRRTRLSGHAIGEVVKRCVAAVGLPAAQYGGHSLRAGFATAASEAGLPEAEIMRQTGHRSLASVRRYIRTGGLFRDNPASKIGL